MVPLNWYASSVSVVVMRDTDARSLAPVVALKRPGEVAGSDGPERSDRDLAAVLGEFARTMATDFPIEGILDHLVKRIVDVLPITGAGVTLIAPGVEPRYVAASSDAALQFEQLQTELGEGPCLSAYRQGEAVSVPDLHVDVQFPNFAPRALAIGLQAVFTFPLRHDDVCLGALDLYRDTAGELAPASMTAAQTLADVATAYLLNAQAREDLQNAANSSREASLHDALTGLPNRTLMLERLEHAVLRARRSHKVTALLFVDLDRFKQVNDTYGHEVGDKLLISVAERLRTLLRPGDTLARLSGDEFVALCEELDGPTIVDTIVRRMKTAFDAPFVISSHALSVTASIGSAVTGEDEELPTQLLHTADLAMYRTKRRSDGGREMIAPAADSAQRLDGLGDCLPGAIDRDELHLDYQPIVDTLDGRLVGAEALLRWTHPSRGPVSPLLLIPLAEQSGQIGEIGQWVLQNAWAERQRWDAGARHDVAVSVNVSVNQLMAAGFADMVATVLLAGSGDPSLLTLEVFESVFVQDSARAAIVLHTLRDIGVNLALDAFGTGHSSLGHLLKYPVHTIKVDRTFVAKLGQSASSNAVVAALIDLGHNLGMHVVSQGVETAEQHEELTRLAPDACQGFFYAPPMSAARLELLIHESSSFPTLRLAAPAAANHSVYTDAQP